jgi:hypothetical protein
MVHNVVYVHRSLITENHVKPNLLATISVRYIAQLKQLPMSLYNGTLLFIQWFCSIKISFNVSTPSLETLRGVCGLH